MSRNVKKLVENFELTARAVKDRLKQSGFLLPVKHGNGIKYKHCLVTKNKDGWYDVVNLHNNKIVYQKSLSSIKLAVAVAIYLGNGKSIPNITQFDKVDKQYAHYSNEAQLFTHHLNIAIKKGDEVKQDLYQSRYLLVYEQLKVVKKDVDRILHQAEQILFDAK